MPSLVFDDEELQRLVNILANCKGFSWVEINPLLIRLFQAQNKEVSVAGSRQLGDGLDRTSPTA